MWPFTQIPSVSVEDAALKVQAGALLIDVRSPEEFAAGHAQGARNMPVDTLAAATEQFKAQGEVYVMCFSGGRSGAATSSLLAHGVNAMNVAGGFSAWQAAGLPLG